MAEAKSEKVTDEHAEPIVHVPDHPGVPQGKLPGTPAEREAMDKAKSKKGSKS